MVAAIESLPSLPQIEEHVAACWGAMDYRPVAVAAMHDSEGRVLLVKSAFAPEWGLVQGGIERGESLHSALRREVQEETGILSTDYTIGRILAAKSLDTPLSHSPMRGFSRGKHYIVVGCDYHGDGRLTLLPAELADYGWIGPNEMTRYLANKRPEKRQLLESCIAAVMTESALTV